ncbi:TPA: hypothetical protein HA235_00465 [Candidatus Woesearchaeota archaeon]|nr:CRISPR-associated endonuclease Cas1 [Candidatus Woesearchaeota archaeon]HIH31157.1 hypothetical protein [Candidatus Woesearchaeota archaeon]HIH54638.1 hypothetical protein [Candidatus Woesearchaeota archaeon]HIJ02309.1 hypothetical protein [Candidatus Woesearchaeota archaeon]HIJ14214.1 hypothetical protein [Candidatus Woesearchaeota archaeon]
MVKILILNGHGIRLYVDNSKVHLKDGRWNITDTPEEYVYSPRKIDLDHIVIYGQNGNITFDAVRWLIKHDIQISFLNWDGKLLTTMLPNQSVQIDAKFSQYSVYKDAKLRVFLAKYFIKAKFARTQSVLDYLHSRYPVVRTDFSKEEAMLERAESTTKLAEQLFETPTDYELKIKDNLVRAHVKKLQKYRILNAQQTNNVTRYRVNQDVIKITDTKTHLVVKNIDTGIESHILI